MSRTHEAIQLLADSFGAGPDGAVVSVPGRVNLIGEHIDYHNLPVLPMAIQRRLTIAYRPAQSRRIRAVSASQIGVREFEWTHSLEPGAPGDWVNYIKAAAQAIEGRWRLAHGIDAAVVSDLPAAAGLSSSSALIVGFALALLRANGVDAGFEELMDILPEGEHFVGTRGGGMDHAAVLRAKAGCALLVRFAPLSVCDVPIPDGWEFLVAHSLTIAEKSNAVRLEYNSRRLASSRAVDRLGFTSYRAAIDSAPAERLTALAPEKLGGDELRCFRHVVGEADRVNRAVDALRKDDAEEFGRLLNASHRSLREDLRVSCPALDELVEAANRAGALGARLTGAGFGGCAVILCRAGDRQRIGDRLVDEYYSSRPGFHRFQHLIAAQPAAGALYE
jgi:galactokinase